MENDLTPLGEQRHRLPLRRKVKQLERPWQHVDTGVQVVAPRGLTWASSQQETQDVQSPGVRLRCGTPVAGRIRGSGGRMRNSASASSGILNRGTMVSSARRRPSTGSSPSSSSLGGSRTWNNKTSYSSLAHPTWDGSDPVRWDGGGTATSVGSLGIEPEQGRIDVVRGCGYRIGPTSGEDTGPAELLGKKQPVQTSSKIMLSSNMNSFSLFAAPSTATVGAAAQVDSEDVRGNTKAGRLVDMPSSNSNSNDNEEDEDSYNNKSNLSLGSMDHLLCPSVRAAGARAGAATASASASASVVRKRPNSACVPIARNSSINQLALKGDKAVRPRSVGSSSQGRKVDAPLISGKDQPSERVGTQNSGRLGPGKGVLAMTSRENETDARSSIECRGSVSVILPVLEGEDDARDGYSRGPTTEVSTHDESKADKGLLCEAEHLTIDIEDAGFTVKNQEAANTTEHARTVEPCTRGEDITQRRVADGRDAGAKNALLETRAPHISALGYFVENPRLNVTPAATTALHGRALVGNHCSRPPSSKRPLPPPPAVTPGEQPYGASHPLSPTSMGSPPRRHRNSNWGEEGVPLAVEEEKNSRQTVPFVVSGTMLGWKLSTRERKKSLVDSLKTSDYSEHHLIPVYGFLRKDDHHKNNNNGENEPGGEGSRGGVIGMEERRAELRRLEARAIAAERMSMERRARAEGGAGGAAFARAMSRRARARAEWIQKVGDVRDARKENVCRGSSPEIISAYRKRVRDRLHGERLRQRTARGLPSRRPPSISAVTSRADFPRPTRKANNPEERACLEKTDGADSDVVKNGWISGGGDDMIQDELGGGEPYLMLVRAKNDKRSQEGEAVRGGRGLGDDAARNSVPFCPECLGGCHGACSPDFGRSNVDKEVKAGGWGSGRRQGPSVKLSHHSHQRTTGWIPQQLQQQQQQQQTDAVMLPGGAGGGVGLSATTPGVRGWW